MNNHLAASSCRFLAFHYSIAALYNIVVVLQSFESQASHRTSWKKIHQPQCNIDQLQSQNALPFPKFFGHKSSPRKIPPQKKLETNPPNNEETMVHVIQFVTFWWPSWRSTKKGTKRRRIPRIRPGDSKSCIAPTSVPWAWKMGV